jgi:hypothetical protein
MLHHRLSNFSVNLHPVRHYVAFSEWYL